jgi:hypothetical protein
MIEIKTNEHSRQPEQITKLLGMTRATERRVNYNITGLNVEIRNCFV